MEENKYQFEFVKATMVEALTWHSALFTGSVETPVPAGTRAWLGERMNPANHYFYLVEGNDSEQLLETARNRAREVSPIPERFNGGLSFFISIPLLLSDRIRFLPLEQNQREEAREAGDILSILQEELEQARQCAIHEASDSFQEMVKKGCCSPQLSYKDRAQLLAGDSSKELINQ